MSRHGHLNPIVIGLTGSFGSGCTYIANNILDKKKGYRVLSLSADVLKDLFEKKTKKEWSQAHRSDKQAFGDEIRKNSGSGYLAEQAIEIIEKPQSGTTETDAKWVIDSIRNPDEIRILRAYSRNFFLFGVYADKETRWDRVKNTYDNNRKAFEDNDQNDTGDDNPKHGQKVGDCFYEADIVLVNDTTFKTIVNDLFNNFSGQVCQYIDLVEKPLSKQQPIRKDESLMAIAYAMSQRSSCRKRKVGAIIVDAEGNIVSSGYNEVPANERPCTKEYGTCYREYVTNRFFDGLKAEVPEIENKGIVVKSLFKKEFKNLDLCRALHGEENAIVNLARNGRSIPLEQCTLYTTTYPCRMCANKIVGVGVKRIVYVEPYPDEEAKSVLKNADVDARFFQGVTFKAYSRLYGEEK